MISDDLVFLLHLLFVFSFCGDHVNECTLSVVELGLLFLVVDGVSSMEPSHLGCGLLASSHFELSSVEVLLEARPSFGWCALVIPIVAIVEEDTRVVDHGLDCINDVVFWDKALTIPRVFLYFLDLLDEVREGPVGVPLLVETTPVGHQILLG